MVIDFLLSDLKKVFSLTALRTRVTVFLLMVFSLTALSTTVTVIQFIALWITDTVF